MDAEQTTVRISIETRDRLMALGKKGETYEEIIRSLLDTMDCEYGKKGGGKGERP